MKDKYKISEAADYLNITPTRVYKLIELGFLPCQRDIFSQQLYLTSEQLRAFKAQKRPAGRPKLKSA